MGLSDRHVKMLKEESAISENLIIDRGYRTLDKRDKQVLIDLGYSTAQIRLPGLLMPLYKTDGSNGLSQFRPDNPRKDRKQKIIKYEYPKGEGISIDCPKQCQSDLDNPSIPLWITEGIKKGDSLAGLGACVLGLLGVWNFRGTNDNGGATILPDWQHVALNGREFYIVFDNDILNKQGVQMAMRTLAKWLESKDQTNQVFVVNLPDNGGQKLGVDDFIAQGHDLDDLLGYAEPFKLKAIPPKIALLDCPPNRITKPLQMVGDDTYLSTWLWTQTVVNEIEDKKGDIISLNPPKIENKQSLFILHKGTLYGEGTNNPDDLGIDIILNETPQQDRLLTVKTLKKHLASKYQPDPTRVFNRIKDIVNQFLDFDRSLATQETMTELVGCYVLSTWFLDAFNVIGFLWPNGQMGSGKTQLITLIADLSYLGHVILASGSFASLRDLADYGATLAFDDCENLADIRKTDSDKRAFLLAGNRRGNTVPLKENNGDKWVTRHVNTFCPRLFSAISLPDNVLASRTIIVPLIRTIDKTKGNSDPLNHSIWRHDRSDLIDDLWLLGYTHLPELKKYERVIEGESDLIGRRLEPWKAILSVAKWLDDKGASGVFERINALSVGYQKDRIDIQRDDIQGVILQSLQDLGSEAIKTGTIEALPSNLKEQCFVVEVKSVLSKALTIADDYADNDDIEFKLSSNKVGRILTSLRFSKKPRSNGGRISYWIDFTNLHKCLIGAGMAIDPDITKFLGSIDEWSGSTDIV